ncbi:type I-E CRISPR-associated protein Cse1/CasA [Streptomyces dangxiongensis]|uniref:Type I-E CRISPR-associated protein Cse1/CasA n=1 Tax=Streptomyces dangxiongensis TaxID=1442032 RepID=A0A3G2JKR5_9ACTN|nr:type I-E CRISPR-associated protein Cse1/CasA [Streptomyces dangxiongensis]
MLRAFNVAEQPCITAVFRRDADSKELASLVPGAEPGGRREVGLRKVLAAAHLVADVEVTNPAVESMLRRLLTALAVRAGGLDVPDLDAWEDRFDALLVAGRFDADAVHAYFDKWRHRFDLYDGQWPFLQDPRLATECSRQAPPGKLVMPRPSGSNQPWLDRTPQQVPVPSGEALGWLLAWRGYGPSGTGAQRQHGGVNSKNMKAGPLRSLVSFHPLGESLFTSLVLSCPPPAGGEDPAQDLAPWEREEPEDPLLPSPARGPVSLLIGRTAHHVLLSPDETGAEASGCWVAWGTRADLPPARDPFVIDRAKGGPVRASWRRSLLRDFDAFIHAKDPAAAGTKGQILPAWLSVFADLPEEVLDGLGSVRVRALGCHQEKQEKDEHWYAVTTPASIAAFLPLGTHNGPLAWPTPAKRRRVRRPTWPRRCALRGNTWRPARRHAHGLMRPPQRTGTGPSRCSGRRSTGMTQRRRGSAASPWRSTTPPPGRPRPPRKGCTRWPRPVPRSLIPGFLEGGQRPRDHRVPAHPIAEEEPAGAVRTVHAHRSHCMRHTGRPGRLA